MLSLPDVSPAKGSSGQIISAKASTLHSRRLRPLKSLPFPNQMINSGFFTDGAVKKHGIASTLYVIRGNKLKLAGFFSAKLRGHQITWLPCEIEALSIAASIKHFSPTLYSPYTVLVLSQTANHVCRPLRNYAGESFLPAHASPHSIL